jgi:hypothetical protein
VRHNGVVIDYSGEETPESGLKGLKLFPAKLGEESLFIDLPDPDGVG